MKGIIKSALHKLGWEVRRLQPRAEPWAEALSDLSREELAIVRAVQPFTMTSPERLATLILAVKHIVTHRVPGDVVECGVWRGGSMMAVALTLRALGDTTRRLHLYDTFAGMSEPTGRDRSAHGQSAGELLARDAPGSGIWCYASLEDVQANRRSTGYPENQIEFVRGKVEDTIPQVAPARIALLRLDTDWYESTRHELQHLYPRLSPWGPLILDDYGHWQGARVAVDEYFAGLPHPTFLHRIDYTGRLALKPGSLPP